MRLERGWVGATVSVFPTYFFSRSTPTTPSNSPLQLSNNQSPPSYAVPSLPFSHEAPLFLKAEYVRWFLEKYANRFGMKGSIRFDTRVASITRNVGRDEETGRDPEEESRKSSLAVASKSSVRVETHTSTCSSSVMGQVPRYPDPEPPDRGEAITKEGTPPTPFNLWGSVSTSSISTSANPSSVEKAKTTSTSTPLLCNSTYHIYPLAKTHLSTFFTPTFPAFAPLYAPIPRPIVAAVVVIFNLFSPDRL
ncbi:hypothetical protein D9758_003471 [Tetrapyrgos nigripes]|uniref:Uncharacterized protein n=1 Tax=Tetrapyrgos nigripes TaxID=182062 RepID=A0A8H5GV47_9AGAR|nr:hypothetical protein D9758_003471 [Tetrapyrgos nigripes]